MELLLLILKIILIVFGVVLGLIVLALATILLVPIRYEVSGCINDSREIQLKGKVSYLLSIIKLLFSYENEHFDVKVFLFGFEKKLQQADAEENMDEPADEDLETFDKAEEPKITLHEKDSSSVSEQQCVKTPEITKKSSQQETQDKGAVEEQVLETRRRTDKKREKQKSKFDFAFIKQQLTDEHNKSVVRKIWSELCYLLKHFKFRKIVTDLVFATGDPATTGQALGVLCMIPTLYRYDFKVVPDFEADDAYIKGTFLVEGKVRLIHLLMTILRLIFDKEVRLVVKRILALLEK